MKKCASLTDELLVELQSVRDDIRTLSRDCRFRRVRDPVRSFIATIVPTPPQTAAANAIRQRFDVFRAAIDSVMARRGVTDLVLSSALDDLAAVTALKYVAERTSPMPRVRAAFDAKLQTAACTIEERLRHHRSLFAGRLARTPLHYLTICVDISNAGLRWRIAVSYSGDCIDRAVTPPLAEQELERLLHQELRAERGVTGSGGTSIESLAGIGARLYDAVFGGAARLIYERARLDAVKRSSGLRLSISLRDEVVAGVPWELLHDGVRFLAMADGISIARRIETSCARPLLPPPNPLRVLLTVSSPKHLPRIVAAREQETLEDALAPLRFTGALRLDVASDGSLRTLRRRLRSAREEGHPYDIWHIAAHGRYDRRTRRGELALTGEDNTARWITATTFAALFADEPQLRLVVLNACHGAEGDPAEPHAALGAACALSGVPAVVAMHLAISNVAARAFASELYGRLTDGLGIEEAILASRREIHDLPNTVEWMRPVLLLCDSDGRTS